MYSGLLLLLVVFVVMVLLLVVLLLSLVLSSSIECDFDEADFNARARMVEYNGVCGVVDVVLKRCNG